MKKVYVVIIVILLCIIAFLGYKVYFKAENKVTLNEVTSKNLEGKESNSVNTININNDITSNDKMAININDYLGMWYESETLTGYSDLCLDLDDNDNILLEFGIFRLWGFENLDAELKDNIITFNGKDSDVKGTITLSDGKVFLEYSVDNSNETPLEFNYKEERTTTETLSGYDVSGNWSPNYATENGNEISLRNIYGSSISYGGYLTLNSDNTYTRFIGVYSDEMENSLMGTYKVVGNTITFTNKNEEIETAIYENGCIKYNYGNGIVVTFLPDR